MPRLHAPAAHGDSTAVGLPGEMQEMASPATSARLHRVRVLGLSRPSELIPHTGVVRNGGATAISSLIPFTPRTGPDSPDWPALNRTCSCGSDKLRRLTRQRSRVRVPHRPPKNAPGCAAESLDAVAVGARNSVMPAVLVGEVVQPVRGRRVRSMNSSTASMTSATSQTRLRRDVELV